MSDGNRIYKTTLSSMAHSLFFSPTSFVWKWWVAFVWAAWFYHIANETLWSPYITTIVGIVIITINIAVPVVISKDQIATDKASQQLNKKKSKWIWHALYFPLPNISSALFICNTKIPRESNCAPLLKIKVAFTQFQNDAQKMYTM